MTEEQFLLIRIKDLETLTGISMSRWSRYVAGKQSMSEATLNVAAMKLAMSPDAVLRGINKRRQTRKELLRDRKKAMEQLRNA